MTIEAQYTIGEYDLILTNPKDQREPMTAGETNGILAMTAVLSDRAGCDATDKKLLQ